VTAEIGRRDRVVAGIALSPPNHEIARCAAQQARRLDLPLVLVHALWLPARPGEDGRTMAPLPELLISTAQWLESVAEPLRAALDPLPVRTRLIHGRADDVLIAESITAALLVVGADRCGIVAAELAHRGCSPLLVVGPEGHTPVFATSAPRL